MRNWAGNVSYAAADVRHPTSVAEVQRIVAAARQARAVGTGHSFNRIADTTGTLVSLSRLPRVADVDSVARTVRVGAGLRYGETVPSLRAQGLALPTLGSLPHISVAGSVATATHGSGAHNRILAAGVRALTMVTADGELVTVDRSSRPDDFDGFLVSLGRLGVVVELVLDLVPGFQVAQTVVEDVDEAVVVAELTSILSSAYGVSIFTDWTGGRAPQVWLKEVVGREGAWDGKPLWGGRLADGPRHPIAGMPVEHATVQLGRPGPWDERLPHFRLEFVPSSGDELQSEFWVHARYGSQAWEALAGLRERISPVLQVMEVRTIGADPCWLSPTRGDPTVAFHFTWLPDADAVAPVVTAIESELAAFDARPHWGKVFGLSATRLAELYPRLPDFRRLVAELDPAAKLGNALVDGWLGLR